MDLTQEDLPLVSVIIPAYNAETRIADTLASVIAQDYANIEIVVVNDCSTDRTAEIARDVLGKSGRRHKVIDHERNRGECAARNTAIASASGELLWCIDADDMAEKDLVSKLQRSIETYGSDISICGYDDLYTSTGKRGSIRVGLPGGVPCSAEEIAVRKILKKISTAVWAMMFKKSFVDEIGLLFTEGCVAGGDTEFQTKLFARARKISVVDENLYIYVHHEGMISVSNVSSREKKINKYRQLIGIDARLADYIEEHCDSPELRYLARCMLRPEGVIRRFSVAAFTNDRGEYESLLKDGEIMAQLGEARKMVFKKPEVFFKAMMIELFPKMFYKMRFERE